MADLRVAILGLDRLGASIALRLRTYVAKGGQHRFELIGHESRDDYDKAARKLKVFDRVERHAYAAVDGADLVILNPPYEDLRAIYEIIAPSLRDGVVLLDAAAVKLPSLAWAKRVLGDEHHLIGFTPVLGGARWMAQELGPEAASDDFLHESTIYLTPAVDSMSEAIDLAVNFCLILGAKAHFLDAAEHDSLTAITEGVPQLLSVAAFTVAMRHRAWGDAQRLTNPAFNLLTRYLFSHHPDALRDAWLANRESLARALDDMVATLGDLRARLAADDEAAVEAFLIDASDEYQRWINKRHKDEWDDQPKASPSIETSIAGTLFGGAITRRLFGDRDGKG